MTNLSSSTPYSFEAEHAVLGGLILDNQTWDLIAGVLNESDFFQFNNRQLFKLIRELSERSEPFDVITISELAMQREMGDQEFLAYVGEICLNTPSTANIEAYRDIVRERSQLRRLIKIGHDCTRLASSKEAISEDVREEIERELFTLSSESASNFTDLRAVMLEVIDEVDFAVQNNISLLGLDTGLTDLNNLTGGWFTGLNLLAARPSMGKTGLCLRFIQAALDTLPKEQTVQFYSLEMPSKQIAYRLAALIGKLNMQKLRSGKLDDEGWAKLAAAVAKINQLRDRLIIDDDSHMNPSKLRSKARRAARQFGKPGLIVVDYLQLMHSSQKRENRNLEVAEISGGLKALSKEMDCPVIALSQLNRSVENRPNKRPNNSDLRDSGSLEQDADLIMFIYRDEYYNEDSDEKGIAEIILGKNRNGPTGVVRTAFIPDQIRFDDLNYSNMEGFRI